MNTNIVAFQYILLFKFITNSDELYIKEMLMHSIGVGFTLHTTPNNITIIFFFSICQRC